MSGQEETSTTRQLSAVVSGVDLQLSYASATAAQILAWRWLWRRLLSGSTTPQSSSERGGDDAHGGRL
jgi:hypothetical protein